MNGGEACLENLSVLIITRLNELQASSKDRNVKHLAFVDLMRKLADIGLSHRGSAVAKVACFPSWYNGTRMPFCYLQYWNSEYLSTAKL